MLRSMMVFERFAIIQSWKCDRQSLKIDSSISEIWFINFWNLIHHFWSSITTSTRRFFDRTFFSSSLCFFRVCFFFNFNLFCSLFSSLSSRFFSFSFNCIFFFNSLFFFLISFFDFFFLRLHSHLFLYLSFLLYFLH